MCGSKAKSPGCTEQPFRGETRGILFRSCASARFSNQRRPASMKVIRVHRWEKPANGDRVHPCAIERGVHAGRSSAGLWHAGRGATIWTGDQNRASERHTAPRARRSREGAHSGLIAQNALCKTRAGFGGSEKHRADEPGVKTCTAEGAGRQQHRCCHGDSP